MAITQAVCNSFKSEVLQEGHNLKTDTIKIALFTSAASLSAGTTAYSTSNEVVSSGSYAPGGGTLTGATISLGATSASGGTAIIDFTDKSFTSTTFSVRGALIYNSSNSNKAIAVLNFGSDKVSTNGTFTISFPAAAASTSIITLS
tara:strand:+ start:287 stop:724 length:438 start_codon:yes stop_codon:yes gene_type:complete